MELHNRGNTSLDLTGWSVQYTGAAGTTWTSITALSSSIAPGGYYLVQEASEGATGAALPTPDATGTIALAAGAGKVALVSSTTGLSGACPFGATLVDFVGYGTAAGCFEGGGPAPSGSVVNAALRGAAGCTDTNDNAADFSEAAATPRTLATAANICACGAI